MNNEEQILATLQKLLDGQEQSLAIQKQALENQLKAVASQQLALKNQISNGRIYRVAVSVAAIVFSVILYHVFFAWR